MPREILVPNYRKGIQIPAIFLKKHLGKDTRVILFMEFETFFVLAGMDETTALANQVKTICEAFPKETLKNSTVDTMYTNFTLTKRHLPTRNQESIDIFIAHSGVLRRNGLNLPLVAVQPASVENLVNPMFVTAFTDASATKGK